MPSAHKRLSVSGRHLGSAIPPNLPSAWAVPMDELRCFLIDKPHTAIIRHILGRRIPGIPALGNRMVLNCLDLESFERANHIITELGMTTVDSADLWRVADDPGSHGENVLRKMWPYNYRLLAISHFVNTKHVPANPENFRFGHTRFVTEKQCQGLLDEAFNWPMDPMQPELGPLPQVFLGHAVDNDLQKLQDAVGWSREKDGAAIVAIIDSQTIAEENGVRGLGNKIGLEFLTEKKFGVKFGDGHIGGNDAMYTMFDTINMAMEGELPIPKKTAQEVMNDLESFCYDTEPPKWGIELHCTKCNSKQHLVSQCKAHVSCRKCRSAHRWRMAKEHVTALCTWID